MMIGRRDLLIGAALLGTAPAAAQELTMAEVWRDPTCGCCRGWVDHMRRAGFWMRETVVPSLDPVRAALGMPADLASCHLARVGGFVLEGHVPALAVRRLLAERPQGARGLSVPGMPVGSPGMEVPGQPAETYDVIAFDAGAGRRIFMRFRGGQPI